ncbi:hypothetical protein SAMN04489712_104183 [Thermomonospora echinospora]|uniref:Uncharacterized protein n=1 Tax=Thermomonospora echinospora TaxID=1992 RepID=A0A1H5YTJ7_9ACTN|nr:hypothetical protein SAMN04489712_104183 [Thermomonospora echinospora]
MAYSGHPSRYRGEEGHHARLHTKWPAGTAGTAELSIPFDSWKPRARRRRWGACPADGGADLPLEKFVQVNLCRLAPVTDAPTGCRPCPRWSRVGRNPGASIVRNAHRRDLTLADTGGAKSGGIQGSSTVRNALPRLATEVGRVQFAVVAGPGRRRAEHSHGRTAGIRGRLRSGFRDRVRWSTVALPGSSGRWPVGGAVVPEPAVRGRRCPAPPRVMLASGGPGDGRRNRRAHRCAAGGRLWARGHRAGIAAPRPAARAAGRRPGRRPRPTRCAHPGGP